MTLCWSLRAWARVGVFTVSVSVSVLTNAGVSVSGVGVSVFTRVMG